MADGSIHRKRRSVNTPDRIVYILFRETGVPFYVGKGAETRPYRHIKEALRPLTPGSNKGKIWVIRHLLSVIGEVPNVTIATHLTDVEASAYEIAFIAAIGREDLGKGPLKNLTDGGDGVCGWEPSAITRQRIGNGNRGLARSDIARERMRNAQLGRKHPEHVKAKISASQRKRTMSLEARQHLSKINTGKKLSEETKAKLAITSSRYRHTPEVRARMSIAQLGHVISPQGRARISAANSGRFWITDGINNQNVAANSNIPDGWQRGRIVI